MASTTTFEKSKAAFRQCLPDLSSPRFQIAKTQSPYEYSEAFQKNHVPPWLYDLTQAWAKLLEEPYKGLTTDGKIIPGLYQRRDEGVPIAKIVDAVNNVLTKTTSEEKTKMSYPINAKEWRAWSNPEFLLRPFGLRLEEIDEDLREAILDVLKATLSPEGYEKAVGAMRVNHFLGEVCEVPRIMNQYSYNFLLFGTPSLTESWGWSFYGHHLCLNVFLRGTQIFITPWFTGAEPNIIDDGPWYGTEILNVEGQLGLQLMQSLPQDLKDKAQIFKQMHDPGMKQTGDLVTDRWNKDDQRHLCGAFRDNRTVPYEGIRVSSFSKTQKTLLLKIFEQYLLYLPQPARSHHLSRIESFFDSDTYFCWIGGYGDEDPFYYRVQSPVIVTEFDHHSGVFLNNSEPKKFHTHTLLRTPNAGDYGNAIRERGEEVQ